MAIIRMTFYSTALKVTTNCNIIMPDNSNDVTPINNGQYKILYLLHAYLEMLRSGYVLRN